MRFAATLIVSLVAAGTAFAQESGNPAVTLPASPNPTDQIFIRQAAIGGMAEVDLGKLAGSRAQNDAVKKFAQQMVDDHGKANDKLMKLARSKKAFVPKSPELDPEVKMNRARLEKLNGAPFDAAYIAQQIGDHQKTAHLLEHVIGSGQDGDVKAYAIETLPTVMRHLELAQSIQASLASTKTRMERSR